MVNRTVLTGGMTTIPGATVKLTWADPAVPPVLNPVHWNTYVPAIKPEIGWILAPTVEFVKLVIGVPMMAVFGPDTCFHVILLYPSAVVNRAKRVSMDMGN